MSDNNQNTNGTTAGSDSTVKEEKNITIFDIIEDHETFPAILSMQFTTESQFCRSVNDIFHNIFADYYGAKLVFYQGVNIPSLELYFDHADHSKDTLPVCCSKDLAENTKNTFLHQMRNRDNKLNLGDKYFITESGQQILKDILQPVNSIYVRSTGEIKWNKVCSDVSDPTMQAAYRIPNTQKTKVSFIDPNRIAELIYGDKSSDGNTLEYAISAMSSCPIPGYQWNRSIYSADRIIRIDQFYKQNVEKFATKVGIFANAGLNIVTDWGGTAR